MCQQDEKERTASIYKKEKQTQRVRRKKEDNQNKEEKAFHDNGKKNKHLRKNVVQKTKGYQIEGEEYKRQTDIVLGQKRK